MSCTTPERKFIHDLASPLAAALLTLETAIEGARAGSDPVALGDLEMIQVALDKMSRQLQERRAILIGEPSLE
jgi:hypothetical protein